MTVEQILKEIEQNEAIKEAGSYYDEIELLSFTRVTERSATLMYRARRRGQGFQHTPVYDYKLTIVHRGRISQTIAIPN